ncbi:MAG: aminotransferase class I/II-fold pyridoxal phosphate-dependent enzyme [Saprospiraceae bacterium]|nr:aminotransferase class I/II-fold pyridoxal phosphate-dependent enzyme [Saprospiraceae bacterium]HMW39591.1 aminotransferase class I/II-fold pyridoxal phosphate-dependent enzyme [Saprospiraceae bacterium]HMX87205.1 aminotransferase class I/II-fold pyridoxal phosphate-dependent enzyme [Saprospiraceae bacterium]HMZ38715.1 aminotransferase class I/II-fold pyridoxal phosphate-dependent enzyme [Saprospiraceae bacterium]HNA63902.1 aminotransferase class I/II-fold pyridoxal phosphate-dependent enzym
MKKLSTICAGSSKDLRTSAPHQLPIYATAAFTFCDLEEGMRIFENQPGAHVYSRYGNPTVEAVAQKIADLEAFGLGEKAFGLMTSSGMAAIHLALESCLSSGDTLLTQKILYGGTTELIEKLFKKNGIKVIYDDLEDRRLVEKLVNDNQVKAIFAETPVNPTLQCVDLKMLVSIAKKSNARLIVDNTFATPILCRPLTIGAHLVVHSTTKYLHGHGYSTGGAVVCSEEHFFKTKLWTLYKLIGSNASPFEAWLVDMGMKTLHLRMERHCQNAMKLAQWFEKQPLVKKVNYPGLKKHHSHLIAKKQMSDFGAMMSIEINRPLKTVQKFVNRLKLCTITPTLGETDTIVLHPASMSHLKVPRDVRLQQGVTDGLVRISVGLEDVQDIIADWKQAMVMESRSR